jgi:cell division septal protein FtsQ
MDTKRFNNPEYKKQIKAVRNYRRPVQTTPESNFEKVLFSTGLGSLRNRIFAGLALVVIIYLIYFAQFLRIKNVVVDGTDQQTKQEVLQNFQDFTKTYRWYLFPEKNILFFSKANFKNYLLNTNYKVSSVEQISTRLWNHLYLSIKPRTPAYTLQVGTNSYILNTDSTIGAQITPADLIGDQQLILVKDTAEESVNPGEKFLEPSKNSFLQSVSADIETKLMLPIESYEVPGKASDQVIIHLKKGFKVYFTSTTDPKEYFKRFYTLWLQLSPDQQNKLAYFDLRFDKSAYGCYKIDPCAKQ